MFDDLAHASLHIQNLSNSFHGQSTCIAPSIACWIIWIKTFFDTYIPTYLPTYLPTYIPTYLPTYLPTHVRTFVGTKMYCSFSTN